MIDKPSPLAVGDTVAFTDAFLERHSRSYRNMPSARGKVGALLELSNGIILADVAWDTPGLPKRVNVKNLATKIAPDGRTSRIARDTIEVTADTGPEP